MGCAGRFVCFLFFKHRSAYGFSACRVGSEMCFIDRSLLALLEAGKMQSLDKFLWDSFGALLEDGTLRKLGQVGWGLVWGLAGRWDATKAWTSRFGRCLKLGRYKAWTSCFGTALGRCWNMGHCESLDKSVWDLFGALLEDGTLRKLGQVAWGLVVGDAGTWEPTKAWTSRVGSRCGRRRQLGRYRAWTSRLGTGLGRCWQRRRAGWGLLVCSWPWSD